MDAVTRYSSKIDSWLLTRSDMPGRGVIAVVPGLWIPVEVDGMKVYPYGLLTPLSSEDAAWEWHKRRVTSAPRAGGGAEGGGQ